MKKKKYLEADIFAFSAKGNGIGQGVSLEGKPVDVEVPFAIPKDKVKSLLLRKRGGIYKSLLEEILVASPDRVEPRCIHFGTCGGCRWQQISYEYQLSLKQAYITKSFGAYLKGLAIQPILPCQPPWNYRNKMEFSFSSNAQKDRFLGLMMDSSRGKVFNLTECHLVTPWYAECVQAVRGWWQASDLEAFHPFKNTGSLRTLTLREGQRTGDRLVMLTVSGNPDFALKKHHLESFVKVLKESFTPLQGALSIFLRIHQAVKGTETQFFEMHLDGPDHIREILHVSSKNEEPPLPLQFKISPTAFFQPNTAQAEKLYSLAIQLSDLKPHEIVYDLYCGTGTLGIAASRFCQSVVGIEIAPEAVLDAKANAALNNCQNVSFLGGDVQVVLENIFAEKNHPLPDVVFTDPPRVGLGVKAIQQILKLSPKKIVYISCNPSSQSQDLPLFLEAGYFIKCIQPVDQFPQTVHVENILVLEKGPR